MPEDSFIVKKDISKPDSSITLRYKDNTNPSLTARFIHYFIITVPGEISFS